MEYYLMFHLDRDGQVGILLHKTNDLSEMDKFIENNFKNRSDVINFYRDDIQEFCLDEKERIKKENKKNHHNRLGAVSLFGRYENNYGVNYIKIPIMYKGDNKLLPPNACIRKIKEEFEDRLKLKKLYIEKRYLLSKFEFDLLSSYLNFSNPNAQDDFILEFTDRIKNSSLEKQYFFFRCLLKLCSLSVNTLKVKKGVINTNLNIPENCELVKDSKTKIIKYESYSDDDLFTSFIEDSDYEGLNKYYTLEKILRDSNYPGDR